MRRVLRQAGIRVCMPFSTTCARARLYTYTHVYTYIRERERERVCVCVYVCVCVCTLTHIVGDKQYIICINLYEHNTGARCSEEPEKMRSSSDSKENTFYSKENTFYNRENTFYTCARCRGEEQARMRSSSAGRPATSCSKRCTLEVATSMRANLCAFWLTCSIQCTHAYAYMCIHTSTHTHTH